MLWRSRFSSSAFVRLDGGGPLLLERSNLSFDLALVESDHLVVGMGVDAECRANREEDLLLVHLRVALDRLVLDSGRDLAQLGDGLLAQLFIGMCHAGQVITGPDEGCSA